MAELIYSELINLSPPIALDLTEEATTQIQGDEHTHSQNAYHLSHQPFQFQILRIPPHMPTP